MSKNEYIQMTTSKLVYLMQRGDQDARTEAVRRVTRPEGSIKAKNVKALDAAILAMDLGKPVPHRSTTIGRTQTPARTVSVPAAKVPTECWLTEDFAWDGDILVHG